MAHEKMEFTYVGNKELDINRWSMDYRKYDVDKAIEDGILVKMDLQVFAGHSMFLCEYWNGPDAHGWVIRTLEQGLPRDETDLPDWYKIVAQRNKVLESYGDEYLLPKEEEVSADTTA